MPCYHPLTAYRSKQPGDNKKHHIAFKSFPDSTELQLPCGKCIGCRLERSKQWAIRCVHEASLYDENSFLTLTYDNEHLPHDESINVRHYQLFMKRLRKAYPNKKIRYFHCGEYGEKLSRPHYHAILFNHDFEDKKRYNTKLYHSEKLDDLWQKGLCTIGEVTFESCAYVARYITKKINGAMAPEHYSHVTRYGELVQLQPEYISMSRKPGIAKPWLDKYKDDVYPHDYVVMNNKKLKPPKFYDAKFEENHPEILLDIKIDREYNGFLREHDNTPDRLSVKEKLQKLKQTQRSYECY